METRRFAFPHVTKPGKAKHGPTTLQWGRQDRQCAAAIQKHIEYQLLLED